MTTSLQLRITTLEGQLDTYRQAYETLLETKILLTPLDGQASREQLIVQLAKFREACWWLIQIADYKLTAEHHNHLRLLMELEVEDAGKV